MTVRDTGFEFEGEMADLTPILQRLDRIERLLLDQKTIREWYSTDEFAEIVGKAEFTCREWCRLGRIHAEKRQSGRGKHAAWAIAHAELLRYQRDGLLPDLNRTRS